MALQLIHGTVVNPINNYVIIPYIGKYVNISEKWKGEKGMLDINYWVLDYNAGKVEDSPRARCAPDAYCI